MDKKTKNTIPWELMIDHLQGNTGADELEKLDVWLNADQKHQALWDEIQLIWIGIRKENAGFQPDKEKAWSMIEARLKKDHSGRKYKITRFRQVAAACALLIAGILTGMFLNTSGKESVLITYETQAGKSLVTLPDGSQVWLNAHSGMSFPTDFGKSERKVEIHGEAFFDVSHRPDVPFMVQLSGLKVKVHGTRFNVKDYGNPEDIEVTLLEGSVSLLVDGQPETFLDPGYMALYSRHNRNLNILSSDTLVIAAWAGNKLVLEDQPLERVAEALQVWYGKSIEVDPGLKTAHFYRLTIREESLEEVLQLMQKTGKFEYKIVGDKAFVY